MIKSMTAYSRASVASPVGKFVIEIHCVNRKMLDMSLYLPKDFLRYDIEIRKWLNQRIERGQVTLRLTMQEEGVSSKLLSHYSTQLKALKEGWERLARELGFDPKEMIDLPFLVSQLQTAPSSESEEDEEKLKTVLKEAIEAALRDLIKMKEVEGEILALDIQKRLKLIEESANAIESRKELPLIHYQKKLIDRLKEAVSLEMEDRGASEVVILAQRMDITEELVRLRAHLQRFQEHLSSLEKSIGRTLDFLTQEMHREINTLGAKSADSEISSFVVKMKSELDKIREQVQNIE